MTIEQDIKTKLFEKWLPDKPGGLAGLVSLAAEAATEASLGEAGCGHAEELRVLKEQVELLTEQLHFADPSQEEGQDVDGDIPDPDLTSYECTQCKGTRHGVNSAIGQEHLSQYLREQVEANVEPVAPGESAGK